MRIHLHCSIDELHGLIKIEKNPYVRTRLHAIAMAYENKSASQIASLLGYSSRAIFKWIKNYNLRGRDGLLDKPGRGKPPLFSDEETKRRFCQRIETGPTDGKSVFHGPDIQAILKEEFGKVRSLSDVYYLLHSLGYEWLSPRPRHYRADREKQAEFKKKSPKR
jgi:transposase